MFVESIGVPKLRGRFGFWFGHSASEWLSLGDTRQTKTTYHLTNVPPDHTKPPIKRSDDKQQIIRHSLYNIFLSLLHRYRQVVSVPHHPTRRMNNLPHSVRFDISRIFAHDSLPLSVLWASYRLHRICRFLKVSLDHYSSTIATVDVPPVLNSENMWTYLSICSFHRNDYIRTDLTYARLHIIRPFPEATAAPWTFNKVSTNTNSARFVRLNKCW